jgi:hypothetical protein
VKSFLESTEIIDWRDLDVLARAQTLREGSTNSVETARRSFEWVRDEIKHSADYGLITVTCSASEVLRHRNGYCYAKSHLLAALLRANGLPAGFCYQRLSLDGRGAPYCLHGFNAVWLPDVGWYRIDPRGNRGDINAQFAPPVEQLAFSPSATGEADLPEIWADPLPVVVNALRAHATTDTLSRNLPDVELLTGR